MRLLALAVAGLPATPIALAGDTDAERKSFHRDLWSTDDIIDHVARLEREAAELRIEAIRLRTPHRSNWNIVEALNATSSARGRLAKLRGDVARIRLQHAARQRMAEGAASPWTWAGGLPGVSPSEANHGRTLFATLCAGASFFDAFCGPFLASFERAYGLAAARHRMLVFVADVPEWMVELATERFKPWCRIEWLSQDPSDKKVYSTGMPNSGTFVCDMRASGDVHCEVENELTKERKTKVDFRDTLLQSGIIRHLEDQDSHFCYAVFIDSDTLFVRPIGRFLPPCGLAAEEGDDAAPHAGAGAAPGVDWDVGITAYGRDFAVPWSADTADVARTRSGFVRINGGVVLVSLRRADLAKRFLRAWANVAVWLDTGGEEELDGIVWSEEEKAQWRVRRDGINKEYRGPSQASLVLLLCAFDESRLHSLLGWDDCRACSETVEAQIDLGKGEPPMSVRFRALPARQLNHPESMPNKGAFPPDLLIVHLKGFWWRQVLDNQALFLVDEFRRTDWNRDALMLHFLLYEIWTQELPPGVRIRKETRGIVFGPDGKQMSGDEFSQRILARRKQAAAAAGT